MEQLYKLKVHFLGAAGTVTGSKFLLEVNDKKILIDCGLFQGLKKLRLLNWENLPIHAKEIDTVLLTHGHLDHSAYLPRLVKQGYRGTINGTIPTLDIARIILLDTAKIQEEEAKKANEEAYTKNKPAEALYTIQDAQMAIARFKAMPLNEWLEIFPNIKVRFQYNGHILGATFIELDVFAKFFVFSGDIGREKDVLLRAPTKPQKADYIFLESTYGDRLHPKENVEDELIQIIKKTVQDKGTLIIPSFAVERTQSVMYLLWKLQQKNAIPKIPMIMDSPMGLSVLEVFYNATDWHKLSVEEFTEMCQSFKIIEDYKETWETIDMPESKIIIAGSGMLSGGRVLTYLQQYLDRKETAILMVGFQAEGTRGRQLLEGAHELKIYGKYYDVKANIYNINALSAHADQEELLNWLSEIKGQAKKVFLIHGEAQAADSLRVKIKDIYGWEVEIPELYSSYDLDIENVNKKSNHN